MFDTKTLQELGLKGLTKEQEDAMLDKLNTTLQVRVGTVLTRQLSEKDLAEFEKVVDGQGDEAAQKWLEGKIPGYQDVLATEAKALLDDIKQLNRATEDAIANK